MTIQDLLDAVGGLRYGMSTADKERLALSGALPGAPEDDTAEQKAAQRYAAGFLFGRQHPTLAAIVQPAVSRLKVSDLPLFGGSSPELQSFADSGVSQGIGAAEGGLTIQDLLGLMGR